jgi:hypothetical protein
MNAAVFRSRVLAEIQSLDPQVDAQRIVMLSSRFDFPWDMVRSLEIALFRTFCVPNISRLLDRTGEFQQRAQKRYDDTDIIVSELIDWGYDSPRGRAALRRMNQLHGRFDIANEDFQYVLSTFIYEPIRWNAQYGWRHYCEQEQMSLFFFWREIGRRMNIRDLPEAYAAFERFNRQYEREHFQYCETNFRVGAATREMFLSWFPRPLRPVAVRGIYALMDEPLLDAFGFPKSSRLEQAIVRSALRLRGRLLACIPRPRNPKLRSELKRRSYPLGHQVEQVGPD